MSIQQCIDVEQISCWQLKKNQLLFLTCTLQYIYSRERTMSVVSSVNTTIIQPVPCVSTVTNVVPLGKFPTACTCPVCRQSIVTRVEKRNGPIVWILAGIICLLGFVLGCCLIPFCIDDLKVSLNESLCDIESLCQSL